MSKFRVDLDKSDIGKRGCYILTTDIEQKESKTIQTFEGNEVTLYTPQKLNNNLRTALPTIGKIVVCLGDTEFNVGDEVICKHFTFLDVNKESKHIHEDENGIRYYKAYNEDVYFKITGDDLEPRNGVVLSEPILDKLIDTTLDLTGDLVGYRRDIVKVLKTWNGCEEFKKGDYILLAEGGDYHFNWKGKDYVRSDYNFMDILAVTDDTRWRNSKVLKHAKDHNKRFEQK